MRAVKAWARLIKRDIYALYRAARDPRTPLFVKVLAILTVAYAVSPLDLIPDFIPLFGYLGDLIILPLAILLLVRLIPKGLMADYRAAADGTLPPGLAGWGCG